ncbi:HemK/PrmC family methyltransferase [uncultured Corynebacterium sp.]|uniref:N5-glutamine methyltransferase family protein n=1 Tax=uncultured Corynebacterium sp. TaxID=159447 RepID=UPI002600E115|nr:HemK/PrmC family methyltransferase [uncultured Corynebacterium sp.]
MTDGSGTVSAALRSAVMTLHAAGVPSAAHDARVLMAAALNRDGVVPGDAPVTPMDLVLRGGDPEPASYRAMVDRRAAREPLQFILGVAAVVGVDLAVGPGVFIPRPETDLLIDWAASRVVDWEARRRSSALRRALTPPRFTVVDFCSGPGTVSLGLAHLLTRAALAHRLDLRIVGIDVSPTAVGYADQNLADWRGRGEIDPRIVVEFHRGDATDAALVTGLGLVAGADLVLSNPPYVPEGEHGEQVAAADPEVAADPHGAVYSGADGLELMRPLSRIIALTCAPFADVAVEHDDATGSRVRELLADAGITDLVQHRDLAGRDRFVTGEVRRDPGDRGMRLQ